MKQIIQQSAEFALTTNGWAFQPTKVTLNGIDGYFIMQASIEMSPTHLANESGTPIGKIVQRYEADARKAAALARARQKIAKRLENAPTFSLTKLRLDKGLSQAKLGQLMGGIAQPHIARIERGDDLKLSTIEKLAKALEVDASKVFAAAVATRLARGTTE